MYIRNRFLSAGFKAAVCLCGLAGILIQGGFLEGKPDWDVFRYYTLLSNALCAVYFGFAALCAARGRGRPLPVFKGALIMGITVTGIVYHVLLSRGGFSMGSAKDAANQLLHTFVPILSVLDWLLFDEKGHYAPMNPIEWVILPDAYFVLATVYGFAVGRPFHSGSRFPYFFIDYDALGLGGVLRYVAVLNLAFWALGYVYFLLDFLLGRWAGRISNKGA